MMTTSTSGPPRFCTISVIADTGPISLGPTPATAHSGRITEMMPIPKTPPTIGPNRSGEAGISRVRVGAVEHRGQDEQATADDEPARREQRRQLGGQDVADAD